MLACVMTKHAYCYLSIFWRHSWLIFMSVVALQWRHVILWRLRSPGIQFCVQKLFNLAKKTSKLSITVPFWRESAGDCWLAFRNGSKWNLHTVCWSAVGCEWGTTSVYFGITYVCFIPSRLPVFAVEPQYLLQYFFYFCQKYHLNY